ncbi:MAG: flagellar basal body rod protein FlgC [Candidatus Schekmanbacteria bacterium]|nr:flagellar basal body rod protein FlgC [Candidatus Schekmanbacteria bacterium]
MSFFRSLEISGSALSAERRRIQVLASNMANAHTTRTAEGGPYRRKDVVFEPVPANTFSGFLAEEMAGDASTEATNEKLDGVRVAEVVTDPSPPTLVYDPNHPHANTDGYVAYPNVNPISEMVNLLSATRSYEANVAAVQAAKQMARRALDIGQ